MSNYLEEFTTVIVHVAVDGDTVVMTPTTEDGIRLMAEVLADPAKSRWHSGGNTYDHSAGHKEKVTGAYVSCGGTAGEFRERNCNYTRYFGSTEIRLVFDDATTRTDAFRMRDIMYFASGLFVQEGSTSTKILLGNESACKICAGSLASFSELATEVCASCSDVCEHDYKEGVAQFNGRVVWMPYCQKCGRGDPEWQSSANPADDTVAVVENGGVDVLVLGHPDGTVTTIAKK